MGKRSKVEGTFRATGKLMWAFIKKVGKWLWAPVALLGMLAAARAIVRSKDNRVASLKDALTIEKERQKIVASEARASILKEQAVVKAKEVIEAKKAIKESKRKIVAIEANTPTEDMTDAQIAESFSKLRF